MLSSSKQLQFIHYINTLLNKLLSESYVPVITQVTRNTKLKDNALANGCLVGEIDKASRPFFERRNTECHPLT